MLNVFLLCIYVCWENNTSPKGNSILGAIYKLKFLSLTHAFCLFPYLVTYKSCQSCWLLLRNLPALLGVSETSFVNSLIRWENGPSPSSSCPAVSEPEDIKGKNQCMERTPQHRTCLSPPALSCDSTRETCMGRSRSLESRYLRFLLGAGSVGTFLLACIKTQSPRRKASVQCPTLSATGHPWRYRTVRPLYDSEAEDTSQGPAL